MSIKDKIRQAADLSREIVEVPEWDVKVEIRSMSARHRTGLQSLINDETVDAGIRQEQMWAFLLTNCCFDPETGEAVFTDEDMDWLFTQKAFAPIDRLASACLNVSAVLRGTADQLGKSSSDSPTSGE